MKKYTLVLLSVLGLVACNSEPDGFTINGELKGEIEDGTMVFLKKTNEQNQPVDVDTAQVKDGNFSFKGKAGEPEIHYVFIDNIRGNIPVIIEEGEIEVEAQKDSLPFAEVEGTLQNDLFGDFLDASRELSRKAMSMNEDMRAATAKKDTVVMNSLREEYFELQEEAKNFEISFAEENPNSLISALIIEKGLTTGSLADNKAKTMYDALTEEIKNTRVGMRIKEKLEKSANTSIGAKAPNFSAPTPEGGELALADAMGKVTIIDFWAAWCKPCRAENPNVVKIYNKYKDQGLNILGVSLDRKAEDWKKAIEDDGLAWDHVSNVNYFDEIAQLYSVNAIPATFILDENGVIVAKNLRGEALEQKIAELLQ
ncbi:TlpA disulfide reductase family protein [Zeaxanthinibacter sp. PT1]|uniref:TlpA disulfide reductase family protein n=1 Tax=Zeaxanthinibacter TaxID=561554 RepID=UPI00234A130D|nr:TlpA disulfide reductase family protein [Zeaxanthinibacter sp. PT1]MDC6351444.1 TlpA disulfide reductase family protein [Zeaxanthinibacter sp. PT1]